MADNLTTQSTTPATVPSASVIATDDVAGVHFQRVKLVDGTLDSNVGITGDATNGLDVDVTRVQGTVNVADGGNILSVDDGGGSLTVDGTVGISGTVPVSGTFWQATQPVSGTVAVTGAYQATQPVSLATAPTTPVTGTFWQATQPVSAAGLPLPTGASTSDKQPALGTAGTASSDVITVQGISGGTSLPVSLANNTTVNINQINSVTPLTGNGSTGAGSQRVTIADDNSAITVKQGTASSLKAQVELTPTTTGGLTTRRVLSLATSNAINVKATAGQVYGWVITNTNASPRYVKLYNISGGGVPAPATDVPVMTLMVPGNSSGTGMVAAEFTMGITFSNSIGLNIVTGVGDTDTTTPSANEVIINLFYK